MKNQNIQVSIIHTKIASKVVIVVSLKNQDYFSLLEGTKTETQLACQKLNITWVLQ